MVLQGGTGLGDKITKKDSRKRQKKKLKNDWGERKIDEEGTKLGKT